MRRGELLTVSIVPGTALILFRNTVRYAAAILLPKPILTKLVRAIAGAIFMHLLAINVYARALGITVRRITFGIRPQVVAMGRFRLSILPAGGPVRLATR